MRASHDAPRCSDSQGRRTWISTADAPKSRARVGAGLSLGTAQAKASAPSCRSTLCLKRGGVGKTTPVTPVTPPKHFICLQARLPSTNTVAASSNHLPCRGPRAPAGCRKSLSMPWAKIQMQQIQILHDTPLGI